MRCVMLTPISDNNILPFTVIHIINMYTPIIRYNCVHKHILLLDLHVPHQSSHSFHPLLSMASPRVLLHPHICKCICCALRLLHSTRNQGNHSDNYFFVASLFFKLSIMWNNLIQRH